MTAGGYAATVMQRCDVLGACSEEAGRLTRPFASQAMHKVHEHVTTWMKAAGMAVRTDHVGNLLGRYEGGNGGTSTLILGSHLDSVRDAGKYDGPLGVMVAIAAVQRLHDSGSRLPFAIEVGGFAAEEGLRYGIPYLGRRAQDRWSGGHLLGYVEVHIEQGPVLEARDLPVGVVSAINGQSRYRLIFTGEAAHAGTTPMDRRKDALAAAAEFVVAVEAEARKTDGLVATVGQLVVNPGGTNVGPGEARSG